MTAISEFGSVLTDLDNPNDRNDEPLAVHFNYIFEMQKLVGQIFAQLGRISANDHESIERLKAKYMQASIQAAHCQRDSGRVGRNIGITTFVVCVLRVGFPNADDKAIIELSSQQVPALGGMFTAGLQSEMSVKSAEAALAMQNYTNKTQSKSSEGNARQDYLALLQSVADNMKSASRASG